MFGKNKIETINEKNNEWNGEIVYKQPEILMVDCDKKECDKLKEKGYNIEVGTFRQKI